MAQRRPGTVNVRELPLSALLSRGHGGCCLRMLYASLLEAPQSLPSQACQRLCLYSGSHVATWVREVRPRNQWREENTPEAGSLAPLRVMILPPGLNRLPMLSTPPWILASLRHPVVAVGCARPVLADSVRARWDLQKRPIIMDTMAEPNNEPSADMAEYNGASRAALLQALKDSQVENGRLRAENARLRDENSNLTATSTSTKKRRGQTDDKLGYKTHVIGWAKKILFTRALLIDTSRFCERPNPSADPMAVFEGGDDNHAQSVTTALYEEIPPRFHELLDASKYTNLAKDFVREHGDARSTLISNIRKNLPAILQGCSIDSSELGQFLVANADRSNSAALKGLLQFPRDKKPTLFAPILFSRLTQVMTDIFLGPPVQRVHRLMYYGPGSLVLGNKPASNSNGVKLHLKTVTASSIAASATLLRFVLSVDKEWSSTGAISKITWEEDYKSYLKMLTENSHADHVKNIFKVFGQFVFSGVKLANAAEEDADEGVESEIADAMQRFELGDDADLARGTAEEGAGRVEGGLQLETQGDEAQSGVDEAVTEEVAEVVHPARGGNRGGRRGRGGRGQAAGRGGNEAYVPSPPESEAPRRATRASRSAA
ncbi:hypothetical protein FB45DRAFT_1007374 [Roridomyces roridus]|uniref:Uncharacterized protein n=1 Tax=Roridomyces roridus TaxID=1738132 RepID=A0AAD7FGF9_9AGAR|nr:hypothetical protein FB45DRAFT_1007374 [Roridomyces roridus]